MRDITKSSSPAPNVLPGFGLTMGYTVLYLSLVVLLPLRARDQKHDVGLERLLARVESRASSPRTADVRHVARRRHDQRRLRPDGRLDARSLSLVRKFIDALVDLPFALPTAVSGIALTAVYSKNGWIGQLLEPLGIKAAFSPLGVIVALTFIGLPFVVRTVQPALEEIEPRNEEAAASLGATRCRPFGE